MSNYYEELLTLPENAIENIEDLVDAQVSAIGTTTYVSTRRKLMCRREDILRERFAHVIAAKLQETYSSPDIIARIKRHVTVAINVAADITRALAVCYRQQPIRHFVDGTDEQNLALSALMDHTHWEHQSAKVNQLAWFAGPVLEMPEALASGRVVRRIIPGSKVDVLLPADDPLGHPVAAAYPWKEGSEVVIRVVDAMYVHTYSKIGQHIRSVPHGVKEPDGSPRFPGTLWRFDVPDDPDDYWNNYRNERLVDATISAGTVATTMDWVRKAQNRNLLIFIGSMGIRANSKMDPERPVFWNTDDQTENPQALVKDMNTPIDAFWDHIQALTGQQIESFGVPRSALNFSFDGSGDVATEIDLQHDRQQALRKTQIPFAHEAEMRSTYNLIAVAKGTGVAAWDALPDLESVAATLEITFTEIARIEDPDARQREVNWMLSRGHTNDVVEYMKAHAGMTFEEAKEAVLFNLETQAELNELKASRQNDPAAEMQDENQINGAQRGDPGTKQEEEDETDG